MKPSGRPTIYGLMAEFEHSHELVEAARKAHHAGYRKMDAYSPVPIEELHDALHMHDERLPKLVMIGGILGGLGRIRSAVLGLDVRLPAERRRAPAAQLADDDSRDVRDDNSGRRTHGGARHAGAQRAAAAVSPGVQRPRFALASRNRFFLCIEATDPKFNIETTRTVSRVARCPGGDDR